MEIYWPLALIISAITVLNVGQVSKEYRNLSMKNKSVRKTYAKARQKVLEVKSKPNRVVSTRDGNYIEKFVDNEQLHSNLSENSITESLTSTGSKTMCESLGSSCIGILGICLITIIFFSIVVPHALIPYIYRSQTGNQSSIAIPWQIDCIRYSYMGFSLVFYSLLIIMMTASIKNYYLILHILRRLFSSTSLMANTDLETPYFLNLYDSKNLEYFLSLIRTIQRNIDPYHICLSTMTCAFTIDIILIITVIIHVFIYQYSTDLLTIWCLIDIIILSIFILIFLAIVVMINRLIMYDLIQQLKSLKKSMVTPSAQDRNHRDTIDYLDAVIDHMRSASRDYAVKLCGFIVDQNLVVKIFISICTGIGSSIVSFIRNS